MATPKRNIRMPAARWQAVGHRARQVHRADAAKVFNALAAAYDAGEIDEVVSAWLARLATGAADGSGGNGHGHAGSP